MDENLRTAVRDRYGAAARQAAAEADGDGGSAGTSCCGSEPVELVDPVTANLYSADETGGLPHAALLASRGCGNPTALAELSPGEVVLDLGSGGGIDVLLSARRVGPAGKAYGLDMTDDMLELARANQANASVTNVEFLRGEIENIPLPDAVVDVIISNCVINLSADKPRVLDEAFRVLRPGGRLAVSDIVVRGAVDGRIRESVELWICCVAGALEETQYRDYLATAGFSNIAIEPTRVYDLEETRALVANRTEDADSIARTVAGRFMSAFVRATKPLPGS
ncbi:MAG: arsenite methyltransferase [Acidobacteria bacterium]|nr:arsenite methyltransferase [Acidobacteriota bacterium]MYJ03468.1 arsenite methyltransferase [Acidobacteriota bacterium]